MRKLFLCVLSGWLLAFQPALAVEFTYFLASGTRIEAPENAVDDMIIGADATITIGADGAITGDGTMTFRLMQPCRWFPPEPVDAFNCRIDGVSDGAFTVSGQVVEWIHRHDDDNPLKDAIFEYADARASERPDYAPYRIRLQLTPAALPTEHLTFWGFSNGGTQSRSTGAATIGMHVSGLFGGPFELLAVPLLARVRVPENAQTFIYEGNYEGGTPVRAFGNAYLDEAPGPAQTDPNVYLQHWLEGPAPRNFTAQELQAMAEAAENAEQQHDARTEALLQHLMETREGPAQ